MNLNIYVFSVIVLYQDVTYGFYHPDEYEVYMLLSRGGGANVKDVWLDRGDVTHASHVQRHHRNLSLTELALDGDYRTDKSVDDLSHEEVHLVFMNALMDPLWWMVFNGTAVRSGKWFQQAMRSSSNISGYDVTISDSGRSFYSLTIGDHVGHAWAAVWDSASTDHPYFLFNAGRDVPRALPQHLTTGTPFTLFRLRAHGGCARSAEDAYASMAPDPTFAYVGASRTVNYVTCEYHEKFEMKHQFENVETMTVQKCKEQCLHFPYMIMQMGYKCLCGSLRPGETMTFNGEECNKYCPNSNDRCGRNHTDRIAVYTIVEEEPQSIRTILCDLKSLTYPSIGEEILVSKETLSYGTTLSSFYVNGHRLSATFGALVSYSMFYNPVDCDNNTRVPYFDLRSGNKTDFRYGEFWNTTLIRAVCVWFVPNESSNWMADPIALELEIQICTPTIEHHFFPADYLAVVGMYPLSSTTSTRMPNTYPEPDSYTATESSITELSSFEMSTTQSTAGAAGPDDVSTDFVGSSHSSLLTSEPRSGETTIKSVINDSTALTATVDRKSTVGHQTSDITTIDPAVPGAVSTDIVGSSYSSLLTSEPRSGETTIKSVINDSTTLTATVDRKSTVGHQTSDITTIDPAVPGAVSTDIVGSSYSSLLTSEPRSGETTIKPAIDYSTTLTATEDRKSTVGPKTSDITTIDTAGGGISTERTYSTQNTMTSSDGLCTCVCQRYGENVTEEELKEKIEKIQSILKVDKKALSSNYRKLNSAHDPRPSSKSIGTSGVILLLIFLGAIVLIDLSNLRGLAERWSSKGDQTNAH